MADGVDPALPAPPEPRHYTLAPFGAFAVPPGNLWPDHAQLVKDASSQLGFSPAAYPYFDGAFARKTKLRFLVDSSDKNYATYAALRHNMAGMRNYLVGLYYDAGMLNSTASAYMEDMAGALADIIGKDGRGFARSIDLDIANIEGAGASEMYRYLVEIQDSDEGMAAALKGFKAFMGVRERNWKLPLVVDTPFSMANLAQQEDPDHLERTQLEEQSVAIEDPIPASIDASEAILTSAQMLSSIESMAEPPKAESVEEARKILRGLRNMEFADRSIEEFLSSGSPRTIVYKKQQMAQLVHIFMLHARQMDAQTLAEARKDPVMRAALEGVDTIALEVAEHTRRMMKLEDERDKLINKLIDSLSDAALLRHTQSLRQLLDNLEMGMEKMLGREIDQTALDRLLAANARLEVVAEQLMNPDILLTPPSRDEPIELAQEIIRRLQALDMGGQTLAQFIEHGKPEEKARFATQVEEIAEVYRNLLAEAAQHDASIVHNPLVKKAGDTFSSFSHAVSLMAAKEMPNSLASTMQISADKTEDPTQWQNMHEHTINRLVETAKGALEKAIAEVAADAEEQEEGQQAGQEAADQAALMHDNRKKRRKGGGDSSKSKSGKGGKKQRKVQQDLTIDDFVLKQGKFAGQSEGSKDKPRGQSSSGRSTARQQRRADRELASDDYAQKQGAAAEQQPAERPRGNSNSQSSSRTGTTGTSSRSSGMRSTSAPQLRQEDLDLIRKLGGNLRAMSEGINTAGAAAPPTTSPTRTANAQNRDQQAQNTNPNKNNPRGPNR